MTNYVYELIIKGNKIVFVKSAFNLGIVLNGRLSWSNHVSVVDGRIYSMT